MAANSFKPIQIKPLSGLMDNRSLPEEVAFGSYRWAENVTASAVGKVCRRPGYQRLMAESNVYNNQDLHDQLFSNIPQPISLLFEAISTTGVHRLVAGTQNRLYALNDSTGNWRVISDELGGEPSTACVERRWYAAQVEDIMVFTNGLDTPRYWTFDGPASQPNDQSVAEIPDLATINVTKADVVASWKGIMFLANVVQDGLRVNHRIVWSDFRRPLSYIPSATKSLAGTHDLGSGENILAILPLADSLLFYTTKGIWECQVGDPNGEIFTFRQRYGEPITGHGCLSYRNTLISLGDEHLYMGKDGIYLYNMYVLKPERVDWMYRASAVIFDDINDTQCASHVAGWNATTKEAWFSWVKSGDTCPARTLVLNAQYTFADVIERGFTAFASYRPSLSSTIRDFLLNWCICTSDDIASDVVKEGGFCVEPPAVTCGTPYTSIWTSVANTSFGAGDVEDYTRVTPDGGSLAAALGDTTLDDLCSAEQDIDACNAAQKFIMASAVDNCIKQYGGIYAHEHCTDNSACATYTFNSYNTILRSGPIDFGNASHPKFVNRIDVELTAATQTIPSTIFGRVGFSHAASDPNIDTCPIIWYPLRARPLACASPKTSAQHVTAKTQPYLSFEWPVYLGGRYFYWEMEVSGTGGASCYSSLTMDVSVKPKGL